MLAPSITSSLAAAARQHQPGHRRHCTVYTAGGRVTRRFSHTPRPRDGMSDVSWSIASRRCCRCCCCGGGGGPRAVTGVRHRPPASASLPGARGVAGGRVRLAPARGIRGVCRYRPTALLYAHVTRDTRPVRARISDARFARCARWAMCHARTYSTSAVDAGRCS